MSRYERVKSSLLLGNETGCVSRLLPPFIGFDDLRALLDGSDGYGAHRVGAFAEIGGYRA